MVSEKNQQHMNTNSQMRVHYPLGYYLHCLQRTKGNLSLASSELFRNSQTMNREFITGAHQQSPEEERSVDLQKGSCGPVMLQLWRHVAFSRTHFPSILFMSLADHIAMKANRFRQLEHMGTRAPALLGPHAAIKPSTESSNENVPSQWIAPPSAEYALAT